MPLPTPTLLTDRLLLRPFSSNDGDELYPLMSDARVLRYWDSPPWSDRSRVDRFIAMCAQLAKDGSGVRVAIVRRCDDAFIGWCTVNDWNPTFRSASLGYCLVETVWGHGYATESAHAVLTWAYENLDLNRVQAECDTRNLGSARVLEKLGFLREGTLRQDCIVDGDVSDTRVYGLLRSDWQGQTVPASHASTDQPSGAARPSR